MMPPATPSRSGPSRACLTPRSTLKAIPRLSFWRFAGRPMTRHCSPWPIGCSQRWTGRNAPACAGWCSPWRAAGWPSWRARIAPCRFRTACPGATNGVPALKQQTGTPLLGGGGQERGFVSIPELGLRHRRSRLLADGAYGTPSGTSDPAELAAITSFFTVPSMGVRPEEARRHVPEAKAIFAWLGNYRPPAFPGPVDRGRALAGAAVYARQCAACHGTFAWSGDRPELVRYPDWIGDVGTDPLRARAFDPPLAEAVRRSSYGRTIVVRIGSGYAAPPLTAVWASAPFLHNGSVPSLSALLDPQNRPARFMVGGHALDWNAVGLRLTPAGSYPPGYRPFATPQWVDTRQPGLGNGGHTFGSDLGPGERGELIEFLKLL